MSLQRRSPAVALLLLASPWLFPAAAVAAALEVMVSTEVTNQNGIGGGGISILLNGAPVAATTDVPVSLGVGDVLRAELSSQAVHEAGTSSSYGYTVTLDFILDAGAAAGLVQTRFIGQAQAGPETAQGSGFSEVRCDFITGGCAAPGLPLSLAFTSNVISSTLEILPNQITENNITTETGRTGGEESLDLLTSLVLDRALGSGEGSVFVGTSSLAIFEAESSGSAVLELTVTQLTPIPVPAVGWLLVPTMLLVGWARRRSDAS